MHVVRLARPVVLYLSLMVATKERILSSGLSILARDGFSGITLGVLAQHAGMSKSGLFAHFGSKEEVQLSLLAETESRAARTFIETAMAKPPGLGRLQALVEGWLGWSEKAGLPGGCPIAAGMFELDDAPLDSPVRQRLLAMEQHWRALLAQLATEVKEAGDFRADLDVDQFVWELCGIYLAHHTSHRFVRDAQATERALSAFRGLLSRASVKAGKRKRNRDHHERSRV